MHDPLTSTNNRYLELADLALGACPPGRASHGLKATVVLPLTTPAHEKSVHWVVQGRTGSFDQFIQFMRP